MHKQFLAIVGVVLSFFMLSCGGSKKYANGSSQDCSVCDQLNALTPSDLTGSQMMQFFTSTINNKEVEYNTRLKALEIGAESQDEAFQSGILELGAQNPDLIVESSRLLTLSSQRLQSGRPVDSSTYWTSVVDYLKVVQGLVWGKTTSYRFKSDGLAVQTLKIAYAMPALKLY